MAAPYKWRLDVFDLVRSIPSRCQPCSWAINRSLLRRLSRRHADLPFCIPLDQIIYSGASGYEFIQAPKLGRRDPLATNFWGLTDQNDDLFEVLFYLPLGLTCQARVNTPQCSRDAHRARTTLTFGTSWAIYLPLEHLYSIQCLILTQKWVILQIWSIKLQIKYTFS